MGIFDLERVLKHAPELKSSPELAVAAAQSDDPEGTAQALAHSARMFAAVKAAGAFSHVGDDDALHQTLSWFGDGVSSVTGAISEGFGKALGAHTDADYSQVGGGTANLSPAAHLGEQAARLANMGLSEVQHQYRTVHDIEARHGPVTGLLAGLGIAAVAAATVALIPEEAAVAVGVGAGTLAILGTEAAAGAAGRFVFQDSWARTNDGEKYKGNFDRETGEYVGDPGGVSVGQDFAEHLPHWARFTSGVVDGIADLTLDPLVVAGKASASMKEARLAVNTVADFDRAISSPLTRNSIRSAFNNIAKITSPTEIATRWPKFERLATDLANLHTEDDVANFFRNGLAITEFHGRYPGVLPNLPITRIPFKGLQNTLRESNIPLLRTTSLLPSVLDETTLKLSNKAFDPASDTWAKGVYRVLRFGQNHEVTSGVVDDMLSVNIGERRVMYKNAIYDMLHGESGLNLSENNRWAKTIMERVDSSIADIGGREQVYGTDALGRNLSVLPETADRAAHAAAIFENQTGKWAFPDFNEVLRARRAENAIRNAYGAVDDAFYHHFTEAIFKRGALLTGGFAFRIAAAEAIPAAFREGLSNLIRSSFQLRAGRHLAEGEEAGHFAAAVYRLLGGFEKGGLRAGADTELAARVVEMNRGHLVSPAISTGGGAENFLDGEVDKTIGLLGRLLHDVPPSKRVGTEFGIFGPGDSTEMHPEYWQAALAEASRSEMGQTAAAILHAELEAGATLDVATSRATDSVRRVLDSKDEAWLQRFERHTEPSVAGMDPHDDWARNIVETVKGITGSQLDDTHTHAELLEFLARGETPPMDVLHAIAPAERPWAKGRIILPPIHESVTARIANVGYAKVLDPIINFLSREPLYFHELKTQYKPLQALVDDGILSADEALRHAQVRTVNAVLPFIHNPQERSQMAQIARNFMPFYFAQTQAYRRVGRLLADNAGAFRQYLLSTTALMNVGHVTDDEGTQSLTIPGAGFLGSGAAFLLGATGFGITTPVPVGFTGNVGSLNTIFPLGEEAGGIGVGPVSARFGPIVSMPMHALETFFPELGVPLANTVLGPVGAGGEMWEQFVPNTPLRNLIKASGVINSKDMMNAMVQTIQALDYRQQVAMGKWEAGGREGPQPDIAPNPDQWMNPKTAQKFIDRVRNQSRILLTMKALISSVSPVSPKLEVGDWGLRQEVRDLMASDGPDGQPLGLGGAISEFLARHPDATVYTVFSSKNDVAGDLPANHPAQDWLRAHENLLDKYPLAAAWLIPQSSDPFSQAVYNEQLAEGLRHRKAPEEVQRDIYIAIGNHQFYDIDRPIHLAALEAAGDDPDAVKAENAGWSAYVKDTLGAQNPIWFDDLGSQERQHRREDAIRGLTEMFENGDAPAGPQSDAVKGLLDDYRIHQNEIVVGRQDSWAAEDREAEDASWQAYLDQQAIDRPELAPIINRVFRSA